MGTLRSERGTSLAVQWLRLRAPNAGGMGSISSQGARIPHAAPCGKKKKEIKEGTSLVAQWLRISCQCRGHRFEP